jgi:hypothetical protein
MNRLPQPKGWFVYCYLRTASNLPYYVGLGSRPDRMTARHSCKVPRNWSRIRVMRQELTREQAIYWERLYIARYGRKDLGTGCLMNRTDGGDATKHGPEALEKIRQAALRPENVERLRTVNVGRKRPEHAIRATAKGSRRRWDKYRAERGLLPPEERVKLTNKQSKEANAAKRLGACPCIWAAMAGKERNALRMWVSNNPGKTGADYLGGQRARGGPAPKFSADRMRGLRAQGRTRTEIARELGCSPAYVGRVLSGQRQGVAQAPAGGL